MKKLFTPMVILILVLIMFFSAQVSTAQANATIAKDGLQPFLVRTGTTNIIALLNENRPNILSMIASQLVASKQNGRNIKDLFRNECQPQMQNVRIGMSKIIENANLQVIHLTPQDDVQKIVDISPEGTVFLLQSGIYKNVTIVPKNFQTFIGQDGAIMRGSVTIADWAEKDGIWSASGFPKQSYSHGEGRNGMAQYPEDLLFDSKPLMRVASLEELTSGSFYYEDGHVYTRDDPTGRTTEALSTTAAFQGGTTEGVTIVNIEVKNYASIAQRGAIEAHDTKNWTLVNVEAAENHGAGVSAGDGMRILGGIYSNNGQVGIHAWNASELLIDGVTVSNNNYAEYSQTWDAGGIKILTSSQVTIRNSEIFNNKGVGLWLDWDNKSINIENNLIHHNESLGIFYEASYDATIVNNNVSFNNLNKYDVGYWGSDIYITSSSNVSILNNYVISDIGQGIGMEQSTRTPGIYGAHVSTGNIVRENTIVMLVPGLNGFSSDHQIGSYGDIDWNGNTYISDKPENLWFTWDDKFYWAVDHTRLPIESDGTFVYTSNASDYIKASFINQNFTKYDSSVGELSSKKFSVAVGELLVDDLFDATAATVVRHGQGMHGSVAITTDGNFIYTPNDGYIGQDVFEYVAENSNGLTLPGEVVVDVLPHKLVLQVAGDAWEGGPEFTITVDGLVFTGFTATAAHSKGDWNDTVILGDFGTDGPQSVRVDFVNDSWGGEGMDRNLYVGNLSVNGEVYDAGTATSSAGWTEGNIAPLMVNGSVAFDTSRESNNLRIRVSGDSWQGNPEFNVTINGKLLSGFTTSADHSAGEWEEIIIRGNFNDEGPTEVRVDFVNDAWNGKGMDRNLYIEEVIYNNQMLSVLGFGSGEYVDNVLLLPRNDSVNFGLGL